ncbi:MAG: hypothetical protein Q7R88_02400 [bacterium]|nr:hypothetical protein [bacterium]
MAYITTCSVCKHQTLNRDHIECRIAHLQDLIAQIQTHIKKNPKTPLPPQLQKKILRESAQTLEAFFKNRSTREELAREKELWKLGRDEAVRKAMRKFEVEYPDPDPIRYA